MLGSLPRMHKFKMKITLVRNGNELIQNPIQPLAYASFPLLGCFALDDIATMTDESGERKILMLVRL